MVGRKQARQTKELRIDWERGKGREVKGKGKKEGQARSKKKVYVPCTPIFRQIKSQPQSFYLHDK